MRIEHIAMAKTVGLPLAITKLNILNKRISTPGLQIPISKEVYEPVLTELKTYQIEFEGFEVPYLRI